VDDCQFINLTKWGGGKKKKNEYLAKFGDILEK
jgi:hypothetical protein